MAVGVVGGDGRVQRGPDKLSIEEPLASQPQPGLTESAQNHSDFGTYAIIRVSLILDLFGYLQLHLV